MEGASFKAPILFSSGGTGVLLLPGFEELLMEPAAGFLASVCRVQSNNFTI